MAVSVGPEVADLQHLGRAAGLHHADALAALERAVHQPHVGDHALVGVVLRVEDQRAQRRVASPCGGGTRRDDRLQDVAGADALLGRGQDHLIARDADHVLDLLGDLLRLGAGQVDLVDDRDDVEVVLQRQIEVGQRLRLDALRRVHDQDRALAGGQAARDLVGEVHVARRVDQVELVLFAVVRRCSACARPAP